ncbi:MAG TPA: hypothetical protein VD813_00195, partial [Pseudonocardia sp.]|nr:hypothetical protein [Pseudonocardia sp.]
DAELLARAAGQVHRGEAAERTAFAGYHRTRDALSRELFVVTDRIATYRWDLTELRDLLLALSRAQRAENETLRAIDTARSDSAARIDTARNDSAARTDAA